MTLVRSPRSIELVTQFMIERKKSAKEFFTMVEGVHEIDLIFEINDLSDIQKRLPQNLQIFTVS